MLIVLHQKDFPSLSHVMGALCVGDTTLLHQLLAYWIIHLIQSRVSTTVDALLANLLLCTLDVIGLDTLCMLAGSFITNKRFNLSIVIIPLEEGAAHLVDLSPILVAQLLL